MYTVKQRGGKLMKVKLNITSNLNEEKAEFWIKKMTTKNENTYYLSIKKTQYLSMVLSLLSKLPVETIETKTRDLSDIFEYYMG